MEKNHDAAVVILAAGKGTRMGNGNTPKVLYPLAGEPLIAHLLRAVRASGVTPRPLVVVGYKKEAVIPVCLAAHPEVQCVWQKEQRGTGDAVRVALEQAYREIPGRVLVLYGDQPLIKPSTISALLDAHGRANSPISMATTVVPDFSGWREPLSQFSRVIRDAQGNLLRTIEAHEAKPEELMIRELNPSFYCFSGAWLATYLRLLNAHESGEYYLPDLLHIAAEEGARIATFAVPPEECIGINSPQHLRTAEELLLSFTDYARARV